jgi:hypothetical protein
VDDLAALRAACDRALTGHGPVRAADLLATIPPDTAVDRYGDGGVVAELEAEVAGLLGQPAAVYLPSGTMAQQAVLRVHAERLGRRTVVFHPECHLQQHEGQALERLHRLVGRPVGDRSRLLGLDDLRQIAEPPAALLLELPQRDLGGQLPAWDDLAAQVAWAGEVGAAAPSTAPGCGRRPPATGGRRPRSPACSTPSTSASTRASGRCRGAAWPARPTSSPRCASGEGGWAARCSGCGRAPPPR